MRNQNTATANRETAEVRRATAQTPARGRWVAASLLGPLAISLLVSGCGQGGTEGKGEAEAQVASVRPVENQVFTPPDSEIPPAPSGAEDQRPVSTGPLPPDIDVSVADTVVSPGEPVEITARATSDVVDILLSDGGNTTQAFAYDSLANVWRVHYRVPIRPTRDRLGLSVTAKNESHRWRRLWVFLTIRKEAPPAAAEPTDGS
jgi:hypothetical protein